MYSSIAARTKVLGCGTIRDKAGRMRDKPPVCCGFWEAPRPDGVQDFCPAVFPPSAIVEGGWTVLTPWKSVFTGPLWTI